MVKTASTMVSLGAPLPPFSLPDVRTGQTVSQDTFAAKPGLLVMFISRHCPFVIHIQEELARLGRDYNTHPLGIVAICSNDTTTHPDDHPTELAKMAEALDFKFPFCHDESQRTAQDFEAACTPDFFLYDAARKLVYRGQLDDARPNSDIPVDGRDLRAAIDTVLRGETIDIEQKPSIGCNIKWKADRVPHYFKTP